MFSNTYLNFKLLLYICWYDKKIHHTRHRELAGVSKGTVDRVIHKRGKVSQKALKN